MTDQNNVAQLYADFCRFLRGAGSNGFYSFFQQAVRSYPSTLSIFEKYVQRRVDLSWVEAIERAIIPIDAIIRNPNSFIKREEDIIPIAQAHGIGPESVRHLAQHTSLISSVKKGRVTPARILNITKEDSIETYENRFIFTLIRQVSYFLDKRMTVLMKDSKVADQFDYHVDGNCDVGADKVTYNFNMHLESPHEEIGDEELINADVSTMTPLQRIERLRKIFYTFQGSAFFRSMFGAPDVRPPLVMTNVLKKNPNFIVAVSLWNFIISYTQTGFTTEYVDQYRIPTEDDKSELYALVLLQYAMMKKRSDFSGVETTEQPTDQKLIAPNIIKRAIDDLCDTFDFTVDEVRKVYEKELKKKEKKRDSDFSKARAVFERALKIEKETDRIDEIERNKRLLGEMMDALKRAVRDENALARAKALAEAEARAKAEEEARALAAANAGDNEEEEIEISEKGFVYRYRYSFQARLIQGGDPIQSYYQEIKNYLLSFTKVKCSMAWGYERFYFGRKLIAKVNGRGKGLNLFLAIDPTQLADSKYRVEDLRVEGKEVSYPTKFRIQSDRACKFAKELIDIRMQELGLGFVALETVDYHLPYQTTEELLAADPPLVKRVETEDTLDSLKKKPKEKAEPSPEETKPEKEEKPFVMPAIPAEKAADAEPDEEEYDDDDDGDDDDDESGYVDVTVTGKRASESADADDGEDGEEEIGYDEFGVMIRYRYSFRARLIQAGEPMQSYYTEIKNYILSYNKVKCSTAWGYERFYFGRQLIAKVNGRGKGLNLFLPIDPTQFADSKYHVSDLRVEGREVRYPTKFRIRSERALKFAKELICIRMKELALVQNEIPAVDYRLPYSTREELMAMEPPLVKSSGVSVKKFGWAQAAAEKAAEKKKQEANGEEPAQPKMPAAVLPAESAPSEPEKAEEKKADE